jgi:hypothetical protein
VATTRVVTVTHYEIDTMRIFYRLRFPKYTLLMKDLLGPMAEVRACCAGALHLYLTHLNAVICF